MRGVDKTGKLSHVRGQVTALYIICDSTGMLLVHHLAATETPVARGAVDTRGTWRGDSPNATAVDAVGGTLV